MTNNVSREAIAVPETMIERAAKAAFEKNCEHGRAAGDEVAKFFAGVAWATEPDHLREARVECMRAAIEAMREPTEEMLEAAEIAGHQQPTQPRSARIDLLHAFWRAMIDAALKVPE